MTAEQQLIGAIILVAIAVVYVAWQFWRSMGEGEGSASCGSCPKSPAENAPKQKPLVQPSDLLKKPK